MSRLREAFEKARLRQTAPQPAKADSGNGSDSSQLPQEWDFDLRPNDSDHETASTLVRFEAIEASAPVEAPESGEEPDDIFDERPEASRDGAPVVVELPPVVAQPRPREEFWHTYQFGQRGVGKVVVGPHADATLVEQYRRLGAAL